MDTGKGIIMMVNYGIKVSSIIINKLVMKKIIIGIMVK
jgi:hypothetical protein